MPLQPVVLLRSPALSFLGELRGRFRVREVEDWPSLAAALPAEHPTSLVVVDPYGSGDAPCRAFWDLLERFPSVSFVAVLEVTAGRVEDMRRMVRAGVSEFLNLQREDAVPLAAARIQGAFARPFKRRIDAVLSRHVSVEARTIVVAAAEVAVRGGRPAELSEQFGVSARTLTSWCTAHGLPLPRRLLAWLRTLLAAHLLEDAGRTRTSVAAACGYRTDRSLRRVIQRLVGPQSGQPLFDAAASAFNAELRRLREPMRAGGPAPGRIANPMQDDDVQSYPSTV